MAKLVIRIIAFVILVIGFVLAMFGGAMVPDHKFKPEIRQQKQLKVRLIGYIICGISALIFLIVSLF